MDRENIGGNMSGQQSNYISRGGNPTNNKWSLDGVDITDMSATGASPSYYDFDAFQEMTINTGGVDVTQQTGGVGINLVTKSGTDRFKGSSRYYVTDEKFESNNITDDAAHAGRDLGQPDPEHQGLRRRSRRAAARRAAPGCGAASASSSSTSAWSASTSRRAACQAFKTGRGRAGGVDRGRQRLPEHRPHAAADDQPQGRSPAVQGQQAVALQQLREEGAQRARRRRPAPDRDDARRRARCDASFGKHWWNTGPNPTYKFGDQWVVSDRLLLDVQYAHVGNNFTLGFQSPDAARRPADADRLERPERPLGARERVHPPGQQPDVQLELLRAGRSSAATTRCKFGGYWRNSNTTSINHTGGFGTVRYPTRDHATTARSRRRAARSTSPATATRVYDLTNYSAYVQDTITRGRATCSSASATTTTRTRPARRASPRTRSAAPWLPAIDFPGADPGVAFKDFSPRVGFTYDLTGNGQTIARANYARYYGQVGNGGVAGTINPVGSTTLRYPWADLNSNGSADVGEITLSANPISASTNWSAANPANTVVGELGRPEPEERHDRRVHRRPRSRNRRRASRSAPTTSGARYGNFAWNDRQGITSADWVANDVHAGREQPARRRTARASARRTCPTVTYFQPTFQQPTVVTLTNIAGFNRAFNGFELTGRKRMANHWMMNTQLLLQQHDVNFGDFPGQPAEHGGGDPISEDPTNRDERDGCQYDYLTAGSGIGNVYVNAKWLFKLSGMYQAPVRHQRVGVLQRAPGLSVRDHGQSELRPTADVNAAQRRGTSTSCWTRSAKTACRTSRTSTSTSSARCTFMRVHFVPSLDVFNVANDEHDPGDSRHAERDQRQPDPGDRRAARHPVRRSRELVNRFGREERKAGFRKGPGLFFGSRGSREFCRVLVAYARRSVLVVRQEPAVGRLDAVAQVDPVAPAERVQAGHVEQLARHAVGLRGSKASTASGWTIARTRLGELADGQVLAGADVDVRRRVVASIRNTHASARSSTCRNSRRGVPVPQITTSRDAGDLRVVELADQRRQHVRAGEVEVVVRAVEVGRHRRDEVAAVLRPVGLAQLDAGDLRDGVGLVGRLERAGEQLLLGHRLRAVARIDAGAAEVQQLLHAVQVRRVHHGRVDHHVVVDELGRPRGVGQDAADGAGDEEDVLRAVRLEPVVHGRLVAQVELLAGRGQDLVKPSALAAGAAMAEPTRPRWPATKMRGVPVTSPRPAS